MTVVGTYGYMAQEQFGVRAVPASDLYSLGATLIYLVTGSHPADLLGDEMVIEFEESVNLSSDFVNWLKWMTQTSLKKRPISAEVALKELENPTVIQSKLVVSKPKGSNIQLRKQKDELEILIPPKGLTLSVVISYFVLFLPTIFIMWVVCGLSYEAITSTTFMDTVGYIVCIVLSLPFLSVISNIWRKIIFTIFGYTCLLINQNTIQWRYEIFGLKCFKSRPISRSGIYKLEIVDRTIDNDYKQEPKHLVELIVATATSSYELTNFASNKGKFWQFKIQTPTFTSPEIDWLAQELSDFLDLPISRDSVRRLG